MLDNTSALVVSLLAAGALHVQGQADPGQDDRASAGDGTPVLMAVYDPFPAPAERPEGVRVIERKVTTPWGPPVDSPWGWTWTLEFGELSLPAGRFEPTTPAVQLMSMRPIATYEITAAVGSTGERYVALVTSPGGGYSTSMWRLREAENRELGVDESTGFSKLYLEGDDGQLSAIGASSSLVVRDLQRLQFLPVPGEVVLVGEGRGRGLERRDPTHRVIWELPVAQEGPLLRAVDEVDDDIVHRRIRARIVGRGRTPRVVEGGERPKLVARRRAPLGHPVEYELVVFQRDEKGAWNELVELPYEFRLPELYSAILHEQKLYVSWCEFFDGRKPVLWYTDLTTPDRGEWQSVPLDLSETPEEARAEVVKTTLCLSPAGEQVQLVCQDGIGAPVLCLAVPRAK